MKTYASALTAALALATLTACSGSADRTPTPSSTPTATSSATPGATPKTSDKPAPAASSVRLVVAFDTDPVPCAKPSAKDVNLPDGTCATLSDTALVINKVHALGQVANSDERIVILDGDDATRYVEFGKNNQNKTLVLVVNGKAVSSFELQGPVTKPYVISAGTPEADVVTALEKHGVPQPSAPAPGSPSAVPAKK